MNKKLILLALPALLLSGCNKEISAADAKVKAKEIAEHEVKAEDIKAVSVNFVTTMEAKGKSEGVEGDIAANQTTVMDFSYEDKFVHVLNKESETMNGESEATESEAWFFLKDGNFTMATRTLHDGKETKNKVSIPDVSGVGEKQFETATKDIISSLVEELHGKATLEAIQKIADQEAPEGITYEVKYYTSGDGNLTVEGKESFKDYSYNGYKGSGDGTVKYAWNNYLLAELSATMNLQIGEEGTDNDAKLKVESTGKADYGYKVAYPDLSDYQTGLSA